MLVVTLLNKCNVGQGHSLLNVILVQYYDKSGYSAILYKLVKPRGIELCNNSLFFVMDGP